MILSDNETVLVKIDESDINSKGFFQVPDGVTQIGPKAFFECESLIRLSIPNSVTEIGEDAFYLCSGLTALTIPNSVRQIGNFAFAYCTGLTKLTLPDSITEIGECTVAFCEGLSGLIIPDSITKIGDHAFHGCHNLAELTIPGSVVEIGYEAFRECSSLKQITIPDSVSQIGGDAFLGCDSLESIKIEAKNCDDYNRIVALLPDGVRDKLLPFDMVEIINTEQAFAINRILAEPKITKLYRIEGEIAEFESEVETRIPELTRDVRAVIGSYHANENPYVKKLQWQMAKVPHPKNQEEMAHYHHNIQQLTTHFIEEVNNIGQHTNRFFSHVPSLEKNSANESNDAKNEDQKNGPVKKNSPH